MYIRRPLLQIKRFKELKTRIREEGVGYRGLDLIGGLHSKYSCREVIYDLQGNCMFGNMYPNVVSIDNGPYFRVII